MDIVTALEDPNLFASAPRTPETWSAWKVFLKALFALPLHADEMSLYEQCTGRTDTAKGVYKEAWVIAGRRGGRSFMLSIIAVYLATFKSYAEYLAPGERATVLVVATDRLQARVIFRYIRGLLHSVEMLGAFVVRETANTLDLNNHITIEVGTASYRSTRGFTYAAILCDELAFWRSEDSTNPDVEVLNALRPGLGSIPTSMLLCASSPYARRGALWQAYQRHFAREGARALCWVAPTLTMNPSYDPAIIEQALEDDAAAAGAEYLATFRTDVESFISREVLEAITIPGRYELPRVHSETYVGFTDPSGGQGDSYTLAIAHSEGDYSTPRMVLDCVREIRAPLSPEAAVRELAAVCRSYGLMQVTGDRYGAEFNYELWRLNDVEYVQSERPKSQLYVEFLPLANSGRIELLDLPRLHSQFLGLERRTARGGKDSIDHQRGGRDDLCNSVAGALTMLGGDAALLRQWAILGMPTLPARR